MELVRIFRVLLRHRILMGLGVVVAVAVGVLAMGGKQQFTGVAGARVLLDTRASLVADSTSKGSAAVTSRVALLADLMASDRVSAAIAARAGVRSDQLAILGPSVDAPKVQVPLVERSFAAAVAAARQDDLISVRPFLGGVPIIAINASARDAARARKLADAAVSALGDETVALTGHGRQGLVATQLGHTSSRTVAGGAPGRMRAMAAAIAVFVLWCMAIVIGSGIVRELRRVVAGIARTA
jgi:hypothetical protein